MEESKVYTKRLCMTEFSIQRYVSDDMPMFDTKDYNGENAIIGFLVNGSATVRTSNAIMKVDKGSLFYLPNGKKYYTVFRAAPNIELFIMQIISKKLDNTDSTKYEMSCIAEFSCPETQKRIDDIYQLMKSGVRVNMIRALGKYYELFADIVPGLKLESPHKSNPLITTAIEYIDRNFHSNFSMNELAEYCYISQSRLYHLFQSQLDTTPLRYRNEKRIEKAAEELRGSSKSIQEIASSCGIESMTYFRQLFKEIIGVTPVEYRSVYYR